MSQEKCVFSLKNVVDSYSPVSDSSWSHFKKICHFKTFQKGDIVLGFTDVSKNIYFICKGLLRTYFLDENGHMYNKNLFLEGDFAGSKASMLLEKPSDFCIEAMEDTTVIVIPYKGYRELINTYSDINAFYIAYLEQKWVIEKEQHEISLVLEDASQRYLAFLEKHPTIEQRISQYHIAAHLGITPTQLSRIKKTLKK